MAVLRYAVPGKYSTLRTEALRSPFLGVIFNCCGIPQVCCFLGKAQWFEVSGFFTNFQRYFFLLAKCLLPRLLNRSEAVFGVRSWNTDHGMILSRNPKVTLGGDLGMALTIWPSGPQVHGKTAFAGDIKANCLTDGDLTEACMVYSRLLYHYVVASVVWGNPAFAGFAPLFGAVGITGAGDLFANTSSPRTARVDASVY